MVIDKYKYNVNIYAVNKGYSKPLLIIIHKYLLNIYETFHIYISQKRAYVFSKYLRFINKCKYKYNVNIFHKYSYLISSISSKYLISIGDCYGC